jgi:hypothetical protein
MTKVIISKSTDSSWDTYKSALSLTVFDEEATDEIVENELSRFESGELTIDGYDNHVIIDRNTIPDQDHYFFNAWVIDTNNNITIDLYRAKEVAKFRIKNALKSMIGRWYADQILGDKPVTYTSNVIGLFETLKSEIDAESSFTSLKTRVKNFLATYVQDELYNNDLY